MAGGKIFKNLVISHTNDFAQKDNDKIKGWIENNGGSFSKDITDEVTHLLASKRSWKRLSDIVRKARRTKRIRIVRLDWLKDSLLRAKPKKLDEVGYAYEQTKLKFNKRRKTQNAKPPADQDEESEKSTKNKQLQIASITNQSSSSSSAFDISIATALDKAHSKLAKEMSKDGFHLYTDTNGTAYAFNLVRKDIFESYLESHNLQVSYTRLYKPNSIIPGFKVICWSTRGLSGLVHRPTIVSHVPAKLARAARVKINEPWAQCLQLYESVAVPHTYACYTQYTNTRVNKPTTMAIAPPGSTWDFAWTVLKKILKKKIEGNWEPDPHNVLEAINFDGNESIFKANLVNDTSTVFETAGQAKEELRSDIRQQIATTKRYEHFPTDGHENHFNREDMAQSDPDSAIEAVLDETSQFDDH